jgi:YbbR domain-containing protein
VHIPDLDNMSPAYELVGTSTTSPDSVQVLGPEPLVNMVEGVRATVSVANANTSIRENRPVIAVDIDGNPVVGVTIVPDQVRVNVTIRQRVDASEASVQASIEGAPPEGYQLRAVSVTPSSVTLRGSTSELEQLGGAVSTVPIDISEITGDITLQAALELPSSVQALDSSGTPIRTVDVTIRVQPLNGNLTQSRPVEIINTLALYTYTVSPQKVDLLLSGPVPTLNEIEADPNMVRVLVDVSGVRRGQSTNVTPQLVAPPGVEAQIVPPSVQVTVE